MNKYYILHSKPSCAIISENFMQNRIDAQFYSSEYLTKEKIEFDNGLDYVELGEIGTNFSYGTPPYGHICDKGVPYLRILDIEDDFFLNDSNIAFIDEEYHLKNIRNEVKAGDILFRIKGQLGQALVVPQKLSNSHTGSSFLRFTPKSINPYFLVCYLNSSFGRNQLNRKQSNSIIQYLNIDDITSIRVPIPSPEIQKYIGDKVRKAEELREEAKMLKKEAEEILNAELKLSYFSERVKDAPKMYNWIYGETFEVRIDSQYYINETNFINNEMNKKELKLKRISEIAYVGKGFSYTSLDNKSIPYIRISDLDDLLINFDTAELVDEKTYSEKKSSQLEQCDLIFAITGATIGKVSLFYNSKHSKATLSSDTAFVRLKDKNDAAYVLLYLKSFIGQLGILKGVTGATNRHLSLEHIGDIFIPVIDNKLKQEINMRVIKSIDNIYLSKQLIKEAKQDVEDLIEGNFDMSKVKVNN
ncbi:restriction modification system DNA specificity domain-containing protein [Thermoanaerobacterium thermosaccharolyticum]|uniref:Restriction modification system DNA specificity domain-containing protein n=1 Tax=Thermoanaerobacterium thermosaccharolyticum TaxID=1517 RepID=A0A223HZZ9_THETR|nr:restriction endonuclease subunit S [Thermoanaerobacterium thermosaccharolyticum]AST58052.1 restriction modification system DNA specificity domain-containing protein [Thermoanaerobacterium thermosaccharolyticum]